MWMIGKRKNQKTCQAWQVSKTFEDVVHVDERNATYLTLDLITCCNKMLRAGNISKSPTSHSKGLGSHAHKSINKGNYFIEIN